MVPAGEEGEKRRDIRIDLLRVVGAIAVVWLHVSARVVTASPDVLNMGWWAGNLADAMSRWSVPLFVMASGALLLSPDVEAEPGRFYRRRALRLLPPLVFWTAFYLVIRRYFSAEPATTDALVRSVLQGAPFYHLWYLYMIIGLYLAAPFLRQAVIGSSRCTLVWLMAVAFTIASAEDVLAGFFGGRPGTFLSSFLPFVAYFVAGRALYTGSPGKVRTVVPVAAMLCGGAVAAGTAIFLVLKGPQALNIMYSYFNPVVIVMSLCVFQWGLAPRSDSGTGTGLVRKIAPVTLGIYAIHPFWIEVVGRIGLTPFSIHPAIGIPLTSLVAFGLSAVSARILGSIPFLRATVR